MLAGSHHVASITFIQTQLNLLQTFFGDETTSERFCICQTYNKSTGRAKFWLETAEKNSWDLAKKRKAILLGTENKKQPNHK
jgi:hypothetical protein